MPERIQRKRTKGWRMPVGAIYVGRPTRWGNPCTVEPGEDPQDAVRHYRHLVLNRAAFHPNPDGRGGGFTHVTANPVNSRGDIVPTENQVRADLAGHDLACWCPLDQPCHADVLLEIANEVRP
jgi:hypothetical protein